MHRHLCKRRSSLPHSCGAFSPRDTRGLSQPLPNKAQLFPPSWEQISCSDHQGRDSSWEQLWSPHALSWRSPKGRDWSSISLLLALVPVKGLGLDWETGHPGWVSPSLPVPITWSLWLRIWCRQTFRAETVACLRGLGDAGRALPALHHHPLPQPLPRAQPGSLEGPFLPSLPSASSGSSPFLCSPIPS